MLQETKKKHVKFIPQNETKHCNMVTSFYGYFSVSMCSVLTEKSLTEEVQWF